MQSWSHESSEQPAHTNSAAAPQTSLQDGLPPNQPDERLPQHSPSSSVSVVSAADVSDASRRSGHGVDADHLDKRLRGLGIDDVRHRGNPKTVAGQRIMDYERAAMTPSVTRHALGFKVVKRLDGGNDGVQLTHLPNGTVFPSR